MVRVRSVGRRRILFLVKAVIFAVRPRIWGRRNRRNRPIAPVLIITFKAIITLGRTRRHWWGMRSILRSWWRLRGFAGLNVWSSKIIGLRPRRRGVYIGPRWLSRSLWSIEQAARPRCLSVWNSMLSVESLINDKIKHTLLGLREYSMYFMRWG